MCFTLVEIYEKFAGQYLAEVKLVVIIPEVCNPEKIAQRRQSLKGMQNILSIEPRRSNEEKLKTKAFREKQLQLYIIKALWPSRS